ncbi:C2 family cysteine protease [Fontivita pretiosa]|uniref:C2 family cysteine protease n=1 Tax=Fontivita pretiosa TaxID=2989684 RepID=UPI003D16245A
MLFGEAGNDCLYGGTDADFSFGGDGNDVIVSIGGSQNDNNYGQAGYDSFWVDAEDTDYIDASAYEHSSRRVHRVAGFMNLRWQLGPGEYQQAVSRELNGQALIDPVAHTMGYSKKNFQGKPLFADAGPTPDDVFQGSIGDCYFMAPLSSLARTHTHSIRQLVADLGDGTFAVHFRRGGQDVFVRVDADLYTDSGGSPAYARLKMQESMWVPVVEKAWAFFRNNEGTYASIAGGNNPGTGWWEALGVNSGRLPAESFPDANVYLTWIKAQLDAGMTVIAGGPAGFANSDFQGERRGQHVYMVDTVNTINGMPTSIKLRDPYGSYITIGVQHFFNRSSAARIAW